RSSCSTLSSSKVFVEKKLVGGICLGSPTTITLVPRAIAPTASQVGIWEASSETTKSNVALLASKYCATEIGLMSMQGVSRGRTFGIESNNFLRGIARPLLRN